jgi:hypothetical protein
LVSSTSAACSWNRAGGRASVGQPSSASIATNATTKKPAVSAIAAALIVQRQALFRLRLSRSTASTT